MFRLMFWVGMKLVKWSGCTVVYKTTEPPVVSFRVACNERGWFYEYNTEPTARIFVGTYFRFPDESPELEVSRIVNGKVDAIVTVHKSTFDPLIPLFPLEASAN